jgi:hypothetical protein
MHSDTPAAAGADDDEDLSRDRKKAPAKKKGA